MDRMRKKLPKPTPNPKPQPKPQPKPPQRPIPDIPRPSPLPPPIPNPRNPQIPSLPPLPPRAPLPPQGPRGEPIPPSNRIILNFAGGEYGIRNDAEAERIAKKYGLSITKNPGSSGGNLIPNYILSGNTTPEILANIQKEAGVGFAELDQYQSTQPVIPSLPPRGPSDILNPDLIKRARDDMMAQQNYKNIMQQQMANIAAQNASPTPQPVPAAQPPQAIRPAQPNQQAMQNYQNLVGQGIANMQAMGRINPPGQLPKQTPRNISTQSFQTPRPFG